MTMLVAIEGAVGPGFDADTERLKDQRHDEDRGDGENPSGPVPARPAPRDADAVTTARYTPRGSSSGSHRRPLRLSTISRSEPCRSGRFRVSERDRNQHERKRGEAIPGDFRARGRRDECLEDDPAGSTPATVPGGRPQAPAQDGIPRATGSS